MSDSLRPHGLQHTRAHCPSPTPGVYSNSCPPTRSSSVIHFSSCLLSFPTSGSFPVSQFSSGGQSFGVSASASVLPMNIQDWFPLGLTSLISLLSKGSQESSPHHSLKASILRCSVFFMVQLSHLYMITGKTIALTIWPLACFHNKHNYIMTSLHLPWDFTMRSTSCRISSSYMFP